MEKLIYIFSTLILLGALIIYKKYDKKINLIKFISVLLVSFLGLNIFICYFLNLVKIPITLATLSIVNFAIGIVFLIRTIKMKQYQQYLIKKRDILVLLIILVVTLIVSYLNFGKELHIKYITTDAGVHYKAAREFYQSDRLLNKTNGTSISKEFMIGAYTNEGILFKLFESILGEIHLYKVFICFDIFVYFLIGILMYDLIEELIKTKLGYFLSIVSIVIFMLGYPLNSLIYGYVYMQLGILFIMAIVVVFKEIENTENRILRLILLFILNFALFFTYCIFVPVIYFSEGLYFLLKTYKNEKKIFTKNNIIIISFILIIPFILGVCYFAIPHLTRSNSEQFFMTIEGYIYRNVWSNFIVIIPLSIVYIVKNEKKTPLLKIIYISLLVYMYFMFIIVYCFRLSTYYYYKNNFVLWYVLWGCSIYGIHILINEIKQKKVATIYMAIYVILMIFALIYKRVPIVKDTINIDTSIVNAFDIFGINRTIIQDIEIDYTESEIELLEYIHDNINLEDARILILGNPRQEFWFDGFFEYKNRDNLESFIPLEDVEAWNDNRKFKYLLVFYRSYNYEDYKEIVKFKTLLYKNNSGAIYINDNEV